ncbi:Phage portal protein, SPP1 Gp6-like [Hathewaya proteolytica DSM 3090]|uniref:Phage portal protein, SPP1 Gp6-like n=1 Tax=Hathewaya proteolytica DSM 3090 TaxID=1121331 RepID=A0A1M6S0W0_9CLOT|nr:phage portal protein [Hathewaya proteolytica]SHK38315.1 Phage portal protein, SPP1 Gp6-like [Hathewaya proteolytica DSM 3090]
MNWFKKLVIKMLNIQPAQDKKITIREPLSFEGNVMKNRIWYRGEASELDQFFKQSAYDLVSKSRFWAAVPSNDLNVRKVHSGLPAMIVDRLADMVVSDVDSIDIDDKGLRAIWDEISKDNKFNELLGEAIGETLVTGDGAFKITIDTDLTPYPIIEYYSGEKVDYNFKRGRLQEILFYTNYTVGSKDYRLEEVFGRGYIRYKLYNHEGKEVPITAIEETSSLLDTTFTGDFIMGIPMKFFKSHKFINRGKSIFDTKSDSFDALDETVSQWIDAIRDGRVKQYIPEDLIPKNPTTGESLKPNSFDNKFIAVGSSMKENGSDEISIQQPSINYEAYVNTYASNLDMCLQGIISPATLGIDLKKTDNAEAQREKEKATLYTRGKIVDSLTEVIPRLVDIVLKVQDLMHSKNPQEYEITISFGEYASPSFDNKVETVGKAKSYGIMSTEQCIEELYGDTWTDEEKAEEIARLKEENGVVGMEEPEVSMDDEDIEETSTSSLLNGAQIQSMLKVIENVKAGNITRASAISIISSSLGISREVAETFMEEQM